MAAISIRSRSRRNTELISHSTEWGCSVSEAIGRKTIAMKVLAFAGFLVFALASFLAIPILAGITFFTVSSGVYAELGIIAAAVMLAVAFNALSRRGPKNALQIDYAAGELRLGSLSSAGAFVRHRVCPLRAIEEVAIDLSDPHFPALSLKMDGETATIRFGGATPDGLEKFAAKVRSASDEARSAPIRTRIQSRINGFEAGMREVGQRVRSRVNSRFA
jgi:hypothetical protein